MNLSAIKRIVEQTYHHREYPTLIAQRGAWERERPLEGMTVLDATPVFRNTLAKHLTLLAGGATLIAGISDVMPYDLRIVEMLRQAGIPVVHAKEKEHFAINPDIILDCAASFITWDARIGYAELTRSGTEAYRNSGKKVFVADAGVIKKIETCLGTGESFFRAMEQLGYTEWKGKRLVVFGSGKVGSGIIAYAAGKGADVFVVTDPASVDKRTGEFVSCVVDYREREAVEQAVMAADVIVCATGVAGAVGNCCDPERLICSKALLVNMGVEDEFGDRIPAGRVLQQKSPVNFILEEPTHMKYMDATMALHNYGALELLNSGVGSGNILLPAARTEKQLLEISVSKGLIGEELKLFL